MTTPVFQPPRPQPGQEINVTSSGLAHLRDRLDTELKQYMEFVKGLVGTCAVDGVGFGALGGMILGGTYDGVCERATGTLGDAESAVDGWCTAIDVARRNWRTAEDAGVVRYR